MQGGELRHRITIEQPIAARGTTGEETVTWTEFAKLWAAIEPLRGRELFLAQQIQSKIEFRIRTRYLAGITPKMRIKFGARIFEIQAHLNPEERNREWEFLCSEKPIGG